MKFNLEYGFNNQSLPKFEEYELKVINGIKYAVPKFNNNSYLKYSVIRFDEYEENDKPLIDYKLPVLCHDHFVTRTSETLHLVSLPQSEPLGMNGEYNP